jgi:hypothetical protein
MESMSTRIDDLPDPEVPVMDTEESRDLSKYNDNNSNIQFDIKKNTDKTNMVVSESLVTQLRNQINEENLALLVVIVVFMLNRTSNYIGNVPFVSRFVSNEIVFTFVKASLAVITFLFVKTTVLKYIKL